MHWCVQVIISACADSTNNRQVNPFMHLDNLNTARPQHRQQLLCLQAGVHKKAGNLSRNGSSLLCLSLPQLQQPLLIVVSKVVRLQGVKLPAARSTPAESKWTVGQIVLPWNSSLAL